MRPIDVVIAVFLMIALGGCVRILYLLRRHRYIPNGNASDQTKPTVSVCIAARNERHALAQNLEHVLASDYEKLEILVLDDSSSDDTSVIIKSFAQAGVRFIAGKELPVGWVGKNHAFNTLAQEANGDLLLFLDVDTLIEPSTISSLVAYSQSAKLEMLSVLPRRNDSYRGSALLGTMRYFWDLMISSKRRPPAASALLLINRDSFVQLMSREASLPPAIRIEAALAASLSHAYRYVIGSRKLGVSYEKRWLSQVETSARLYFPAVGRNIFGVLVAAALLGGLAFIGLVPGWVVGGTFALIGDISFVVICVVFGIYNAHTMGGGWWNIVLRSVFWPLLMVQELTLLINSYLRHKMKLITWKGRQLTDQPLNHSYHRVDE